MPDRKYFTLNLDRASYGRDADYPDKKQCIIKGYVLSNEGSEVTVPIEKCLVLAINRNMLIDYAGADPGFADGTVLQATMYADLAQFDDSGYLDPEQEYCGIVIKPGIQ